MALVESISIPPGTKMPSFELRDPEGKAYSSASLFGPKGLLVGFLCNHCPYAIAVWPRFQRLAQYARENGINAVAINPNINPDYPEDSPENMKKKIKADRIDFPYLVDKSQQVAKDFKAQCTPDIYLFNEKQKLIYHGRIDDNWKEENKVIREELKEAIERHIAGDPVSKEQFPAMGCSIKWL